MTDFGKELILLVLGGGASWILKDGVAAVLRIRRGKDAREDTALQQWKDLAERYQHSEGKAWDYVTAYRAYYPALWIAYQQAAGEKALSFPPDPTASVPDRERPKLDPA